MGSVSRSLIDELIKEVFRVLFIYSDKRQCGPFRSD